MYHVPVYKYHYPQLHKDTQFLFDPKIIQASREQLCSRSFIISDKHKGFIRCEALEGLSQRENHRVNQNLTIEMVISIAKVEMYHTLHISQLISQTMSIQDNGKESFTVQHSSIIHMKWKYNHIDPLSVEPSHLKQHKDHWKTRTYPCSKKGRCVVIKFRNGKSVTTLPFVIKNNSK